MSAYGENFRLTLIANDPILAARADAAGVDAIGIDIERIGKDERQSEEGRLSRHELEDLAIVAPCVRRARVFARLNPLHSGSPGEVRRALELGAQTLMLPFFRSAREVEEFAGLVERRARVAALVETASAAVRIREIVAVKDLDEVVFGLNDLHLELRVKNHFEVLVSPLFEALAREVAASGVPFGFGGVARATDAGLPFSPDLVLAQYPRLGASGAWLSRSFVDRLGPAEDARGAITAIRDRLNFWARAGGEALEGARAELARRAASC